jgi:hypothetical protein
MKQFQIVLSAALTVSLIAACAAPDRPRDRTAAAEWSAYCGRCHNPIAPEALDNAEWVTAMAHMRLRGNLPPDAAGEIEKWLQSANGR